MKPRQRTPGNSSAVFRLLFAVCLGWATFPVQSQVFNLEFETYNTTHGLPQNHVFCIAQDKKGFIWLGTDDGLSRFDGHEFKTLKYEDNNSNSIIGNSIRALMLDPDDGSLWIGTNNGICKYYPDTETVTRFPVDFNDPQLLNGSQVSGVRKYSDGSVWITYIGDGMDVIIPGNPEILHYTVNRNDAHRLKNDMVSAVQFMPDGYKIVGTFAGIQVIHPNGHILTDEEALVKYPWIEKIDRSVRCLYLAGNNQKLWIGTEMRGLYEVALQDGSVRNFSKKNSLLESNYITAIMEDSRGNMWIGGEAIYLIDARRQELLPYNEYGIQGNLIIKNTIYSIFEDRDRNVWLGTFRLGILKYNPQRSRILHYNNNQGEGSIRTNEILSFGEDEKKDLWVGTGGAGLFKLNDDRLGFSPSPLNETFSSLTIKCIYRDKRGYFWLGTWDGGLLKYHPGKNSVAIYHPEKNNFESLHVWDIQADRKGDLWLATLRDGICHFSPHSGHYTYFRNIPGDSSSLINNDVLSLYVDADNSVWAGTGNGLSVHRAGSAGFENLQQVTLDGRAINLTIYCLYEDKSGRIWLGANGLGIVIINKDLKIEKILTVKDGLPSDMISSFQPDIHDNIWVSTYSGLARINMPDFKIAEVPHMTGLEGKEFIPRSSFQTSDGMLLFGGVHGFSLFHPDSLNYTPLQENIVFTSLRIFNEEISPNNTYEGRKILIKSITETDELRLSHKDYVFTITFAPLTYNWQKNMHYSYWMENLDKEWQYTTADRRFVHYTNLAPGDYILKVRASFDGKNWPDNVTTLRIHVDPPWWATLWFRIGVVLSLTGILYTAYRGRIRFLKRNEIKLENLVAQRTLELKQSFESLRIKNVEIQALHDEVSAQKTSIEYKNDELHQTNEELEAQRDALEMAQEKLKEINATLEQLVSKRTKKLNETLRELETFLYRASHDLRGPISTMLGIVKLANMESDTEPFGKIYADHLQRSIQQLERTLDKLMQKHTIQRRKVTDEQITKTTLLILLDEITNNLYSFRKEDFHLSIDERIQFQADRILLSILLSNLLENAFYFSEKTSNKKVSLSICQSEKGVTITITDNGPGIRPDVQEKIFTMFYRGHELSTGNGLGLYLVRSALKKMNGKISVESEEGAYSRFIVKV